MGDNSLTVRGKKWERKNSLWVLWSIFTLAGVGFIKIGRRAKEKKWIVIGIFYLCFLWGSFFVVDILDEKAMETFSMIYCVVYIGSIVHSFIVKKTYLIKYDKVLHKQEIELEEEKIKRNLLEQELIQKQNNIELEKIEKSKVDNKQINKVDVIEEKIEQNVNIEDKVEGSKSKKKKWHIGVIVAVVIVMGIGVLGELDSSNENAVTIIDSEAGYGSSFSCDIEGFVALYNNYVDEHIINDNGYSDEEMENFKDSLKLEQGYFLKDGDLHTAVHTGIDFEISVALDENENIYMIRFLSSQDGEKYLSEEYSQIYTWICHTVIAVLNPNMDEEDVSKIHSDCIENGGLEKDNKTYTFMLQEGIGYTLVIFAGEGKDK